MKNGAEPFDTDVAEDAVQACYTEVRTDQCLNVNARVFRHLVTDQALTASKSNFNSDLRQKLHSLHGYGETSRSAHDLLLTDLL